MAKKNIETKAPRTIGAFSFDGVPEDEAGMIQEAFDANGLTCEDVQSVRVRPLDSHGNRMVIITTADDKRIRYPIPQLTEDS